uniref:Uncharacterized protein n=1 Tax=Eutreptiella gymnastica TaxID=73025 RepID=A0A7S1J7I5_9EUGL
MIPCRKHNLNPNPNPNPNLVAVASGPGPRLGGVQAHGLKAWRRLRRRTPCCPPQRGPSEAATSPTPGSDGPSFAKSPEDIERQAPTGNPTGDCDPASEPGVCKRRVMTVAKIVVFMAVLSGWLMVLFWFGR